MHAAECADHPPLALARRATLALVVRPARASSRLDTLTAQHVEVAIVLHAMLGHDAAGDYLKKYRVAPHVAQRVLQGQGRRRGAHDVHGVQIGAGR